ncbi:MAG: hypothetical protein RL095_1433 [Verrucomicrobiota bacterium]|jgi:hypothetical protein
MSEVQSRRSVAHSLEAAIKNSCYFAGTMVMTQLLCGMVILFAVPSSWLESADWQVLPGMRRLALLILASCSALPLLLSFLCLLAPGFDGLRRNKVRWEILGAVIGFLSIGVFVWPGIF